MNFSLFLPLGIPILFAIIMLVGGSSLRRHSAQINILACFISLLVSLALWASIWISGTMALQAGGWIAPFGITIAVDLFSASMIVITSLIGFSISIYLGAEEPTKKDTPIQYFVAYQTLLLGVIGSFMTGDLFNLYVWFEVMLMSSFVLISFEGSKAQLEGGFKYTVLNLLASIFFLTAVGLLYASLGTLNMAHLSSLLSERPEVSLGGKASFALLLIAFGMKAGVFPLFFWLPASYHTPRIATSALLAGLLTKVGVYSIFRVSTLIFSDTLDFTNQLLTGVACFTMVTGVLGAAYHYEIKKILSFHVISQIGYMVLGLGFWTQAAVAGSVFYIFHHIVVKTNLFLVGGIIERVKGTTELREIGGLFSQKAWLGFLFMVPAFSLAGMPPLSGFFAKFSLLQAGVSADKLLPTGIALFVGILTLFSMTKIWLEAFWKPEPSKQIANGETVRVPIGMIVPIVMLAMVTLAIGLFPQFLFRVASRISTELFDTGHYINAVLGGGGV